MKRKILALFMCAGLFVVSGCSMASSEAKTIDQIDNSGQARLTSVKWSVATPEPTMGDVSDESADDSAESSGGTESTGGAAYESYVEMLDLNKGNPDGKFMQPKTLDGIDPFNDKVVALTFDDGPFADTTPRLLDVLEKNDVNATFFMVGKYVQQNPEVAKRAYDDGNEIGTHSWDHSGTFLSWDHAQTMDQITRANDAIEAATGQRTFFDRPPEGAINEETAASIGRMQILWGVDPEDWKEANRDPNIVHGNVVGDENLHDGSIVLSHDIRPTTVDAYDQIIKDLKAQGYKFVTVSQLIQIAQLRGKDLSYVFSGSNSAAYAAEHGFTAETPGGTSSGASDPEEAANE